MDKDNEFKLNLHHSEETIIKKLRSLDDADKKIVENTIDNLYEKAMKNKPE